MYLFEEPPLEPIVRWLRFEKGIQKIKKNKPLTIVDLGCGPKMRFYYFAKKRAVMIRKYIGIDPLIEKSILQKVTQIKNIELKRLPLVKKVPLPSSVADYAVGFAMIEHVDNPTEILQEAIRILKKGGKAIFTTPTPRLKKILEILVNIGLISKREIEEHKNYFDKKSFRYLMNNKNVKITHQYFEFGFNNLLVIEKLRDR